MLSRHSDPSWVLTTLVNAMRGGDIAPPPIDPSQVGRTVGAATACCFALDHAYVAARAITAAYDTGTSIGATFVTVHAKVTEHNAASNLPHEKKTERLLRVLTMWSRTVSMVCIRANVGVRHDLTLGWPVRA